jgi:hypothetical protein
MKLKRAMMFVLVAAILIFMSATSRAANENAKHDGNDIFTTLGVATSSGEIRNLKTSDTGDLYVQIATGTITAVNTIATGSVNIINSPSVTYSTGTVNAREPRITTFYYATQTITAGAGVGVMFSADAGSLAIVNESATQTVRYCEDCGTLGLTCTTGTSSGIPLIAGAVFAEDGVRIKTTSSANFCCPAGGDDCKISIQWGVNP